MKFTQNLNLKSFKQPRVQKFLIGLYVLLVLGLTATARAGELAQTQTLRGQVVMSVDERFYLVSEDQTSAVELRANEDLSPFNGYVVNVLVEELKHKVGPVYETLSTDPLQMDEEKLPVVPVVFVLDIGVDKALGIETR